MAVHAEISLIPISKSRNGSTGMSREIAIAFNAIKETKGIKSVTLTALGTQIEAESIAPILTAIRAAHVSVKRAGAARIISNVKIDERLDKDQSLAGKIRSVKKKMVNI
jgi:uncharacterized protein (TIGR00106 family)